MTQQSKFKAWAIPAVGAAAVLSLGLFAAGCGGGGGGGTTAGTSTTAVSGSASKGPLEKATVDVYGNGVFLGTTTTDSYGAYTFNAPSTASAPFDVYIYGGKDTVTGLAPDMVLRATTTTWTGTVNANALTTMITKAAKAIGGAAVTQTDLDNAKNNILSTLGFGLDAAIDPTTTKLDATNIASMLKAAEAAGEFIRRTAANSGATIEDVIQAMAEDATDGVIDGKVKAGVTTVAKAAGFDPYKAANQAALAQAEVLVEILNNTIKVTINGVKTDVSSKMNTLVSKVISGATATMADVYTNAAAKNQLTNVVAKVKALTGGTNAALDAFVSSLTVGSYTAPNSTVEAAISTAVTSAYATVNSYTAAQLQTVATTLAQAGNKAASFTNNLNVMVQDYYSFGTVGTVPGHFQSVQGTLASGVVTANFTTPLNAANLSNVVTNATAGTSPYVMLNLTNTPYAAGTTTVTAILKDGTTATRGTSGRYIKVVFDVDYSSDGSTLTLTAAKGTATATYYTAAATTAATITLTNAAANTLSTGSTVNNKGLQIKAAFANLFSTVTALSAVQVTGNYFYSLSFSGFPMADASGNAITSVQGTFSVQ